MLIPFGVEKPRRYKSFKAEQFYKKKEKAKALAQSICDLSLKKEDKAMLKTEILKIIEQTKI